MGNTSVHPAYLGMLQELGIADSGRQTPHTHEKVIVPGKRLGKGPARWSPKMLQFASYSRELAPPPLNIGWVDNVGTDWGMDLNDVIGDCGIAAPAHMIKSWTAYANPPLIDIPLSVILRVYSAVSGYRPGDPSTDNGVVIVDVLNYWRKQGIGGHKIKAFVQINPRNHVHMKQAIAEFGSVIVGLGLPIAWQDVPNGVNGRPVWSLPVPGDPHGQPFSWGGHCVPYCGFGVDTGGNAGFMPISWGAEYDITPGAHDTFCDEAYAVISQDWIEQNKLSPSGFDITQLLADLQLVTQ